MLVIFRDSPFDSTTQVDELDIFTGNGSNRTFTCVKKAGVRVGSVVQANSTQYIRPLGGFTISGNDVTLSSAPALSAMGVIPGLINLLWNNVYDASSIDGSSTPYTQTIPVYLVDATEIATYTYQTLPGFAGVAVSIVDDITNGGASTSWVQLACAANTLAGSALTFQATGTTLYTAPLTAFGTLSASSVTGASSILVTGASSFNPGDYIFINPGGSSAEIFKSGTISGTTVTTSGLNFTHYANENLFACGRKFYAKVTVPYGITGGSPTNYIDLGMRVQSARTSRY